PVSRAERLLARDTINDVGAAIDFDAGIRSEANIDTLERVAIKNGERVKEALRVIEECVKPFYPEVARAVAVLRYQWYTLEKDCRFGSVLSPGLKSTRLYVLIDGASSECAFVERAQALIDAGVHMIEL